jgi:hypothetical protein
VPNRPQQYAFCDSATAQTLRLFPTLIDVNVSPPAIGTGTRLSAEMSPVPKVPCEFWPQQRPAPSVVTPQLARPPTLTAVNVLPPKTGAGVSSIAVCAPDPTSPYALLPQQKTSPPMATKSWSALPPCSLPPQRHEGLPPAGVDQGQLRLLNEQQQGIRGGSR